MNLSIIAAAISAAAGFGLAWQLQAHQITKQDLSHANERIATARASRTALEANQRQVAAAQTDAAKRNVRVRVDADGSRNAAGGLRIASTAAARTANDDPSTCGAIIAAYSAVVAASSDFIERVARDADQCHSDVQLMQDAWPK